MSQKAFAQLQLTDDNGNSYEFGIRMRDIYQWEKRFRGRSLSQLDESRVHLEYLYEIAFVVAQRTSLPHTETLDGFASTYDIEEVEEGDSTVDPTRSVASAGESSVSPSLPASPSSTGSTGSTETTMTATA